MHSIVLAGGVAAVFLAIVVAVVSALAFSSPQQQVSRSLTAIEAYQALPQAVESGYEGVPFTERALVPAFRRLTQAGLRFTPVGQLARIRRWLDLAGNPAGWDADRILAFKMLGLLAGIPAGVLLGAAFRVAILPHLVITVITTVLGFYLPDIILSDKGQRRQQQIQRDLPDAMDLLSISVEAGLGFDAALAQVARNTVGPLADEFFRVLQEMQIGSGRSEAIRALTERTSVPELRSFTASMVQADAFGIPITNVLRVQAKEQRLKRSQRAEEKAQKVPVKILFPLIFCIMPALFIVVVGPAAITIYHTFVK